jgi:hypothetical protein
MLGRFCFLHGKLIALGKHNKASEISKLIGSGLFDYFFLSKSYHPIPWRDSISRPKILQTVTMPLDHAARALVV